MAPIIRHFTATTFVVDGDRTLLLYHRKIRMWLPPGGHIDPDELPCDAAVREAAEETGLQVELISSRSFLGKVEVLPQPVCILLEDIEPDHQHIDLIYFARVVGGELAPSVRETEGCRWYTASDLDSPEIAEDIRVLGKQAIQAVGKMSRKSDD